MDVQLNDRQEKAIEDAVAMALRSIGGPMAGHDVLEWTVKPCDHRDGVVELVIRAGDVKDSWYAYRKMWHLFIGPRGGIWGYRDSKQKNVKAVVRVNGWQAVYECGWRSY